MQLAMQQFALHVFDRDSQLNFVVFLMCSIAREISFSYSKLVPDFYFRNTVATDLVHHRGGSVREASLADSLHRIVYEYLLINYGHIFVDEFAMMAPQHLSKSSEEEPIRSRILSCSFLTRVIQSTSNLKLDINLNNKSASLLANHHFIKHL